MKHEMYISVMLQDLVVISEGNVVDMDGGNTVGKLVQIVLVATNGFPITLYVKPMTKEQDQDLRELLNADQLEMVLREKV